MEWEKFVTKTIELMGFEDFRVEAREDERRGAVFIYESAELLKEHLPVFVESLNHVLQLAARRDRSQPLFFDVNNYRLERENLIGELAKAAAKKAVATKGSVPLPAMNSYERRIIHVALAVHPEVTTESIGAGRERYVVVKPIGQLDSRPS